MRREKITKESTSCWKTRTAPPAPESDPRSQFRALWSAGSVGTARGCQGAVAEGSGNADAVQGHTASLTSGRTADLRRRSTRRRWRLRTARRSRPAGPERRAATTAGRRATRRTLRSTPTQATRRAPPPRALPRSRLLDLSLPWVPKRAPFLARPSRVSLRYLLPLPVPDHHYQHPRLILIVLRVHSACTKREDQAVCAHADADHADAHVRRRLRLRMLLVMMTMPPLMMIMIMMAPRLPLKRARARFSRGGRRPRTPTRTTRPAASWCAPPPLPPPPPRSRARLVRGARRVPAPHGEHGLGRWNELADLSFSQASTLRRNRRARGGRRRRLSVAPRFGAALMPVLRPGGQVVTLKSGAEKGKRKGRKADSGGEGEDGGEEAGEKKRRRRRKGKAEGEEGGEEEAVCAPGRRSAVAREHVGGRAPALNPCGFNAAVIRHRAWVQRRGYRDLFRVVIRVAISRIFHCEAGRCRGMAEPPSV